MRALGLAIFCLFSLLFAYQNVSAQEKTHEWEGSRAVPKHQIPLRDEFDQLIVPGESFPLPFSARFTCGPCHSYSRIANGWHFNPKAQEGHGRPGEPWVWVDEKTGTLLPLSYRPWPGRWHPEQVGLSAWDFSLLFGRHMNGGGVSEPGDEGIDKDSRWDVSGKLDINCMGCHNRSNLQSHSEWAKQVMRENMRWAATAASGLGEVGGMASRLPATWNIIDGPNPDDTEYAVVPSVSYFSTMFDSKHRYLFDIGEKPADQRCLACHSVTPIHKKKYEIIHDAHSAQSISCADCHKNDLDHGMVRGFSGEAEQRQEPVLAEFSCRGCHLGENSAGKENIRAGRLGAPKPLHKGLPAVHFEKLTCTVCHSGSTAGDELKSVRTSRINRLGIYGVASWALATPRIIETVYIKNSQGRLAPHRLYWPSFWGQMKESKAEVLTPERVTAVSSGILDSEEKLAAILLALSGMPDLAGYPVVSFSGKIFELNVDGGLDVTVSPDLNQDNSVKWFLHSGESFSPLIPDFDPEAEMLDIDVENQIFSLLEALGNVADRPGNASLAVGNRLYRLEDGYLESADNPRPAADPPRFHWLTDEKKLPLISAFDLGNIEALVGEEESVSEEQVRRLLKRLGADHFYVSGGLMFQLDTDGNLLSSEAEIARPVVWPLAHPVRPTRQSLGIKGCTECHSADSAFFFSRIKGNGPLKTDRVRSVSLNELMGKSLVYQKLFGLSFTVRPLLKTALIIAAVLIGIILLLLIFLIVGRYSGYLDKRK